MDLVNYVEVSRFRVNYNRENDFKTSICWIYPKLKTWGNLNYRNNTLLGVF